MPDVQVGNASSEDIKKGIKFRFVAPPLRNPSSLIGDVAAEARSRNRAVAAAVDSSGLSWASRTRQGWVQPRTAARPGRRAHAPECALDAE